MGRPPDRTVNTLFEINESMSQNEDVLAGNNMSNTLSRVPRDVGGFGTSSNINAGSSATGESNKINYVQAGRSPSVNITFEHTHLINTLGNAYSIVTPGTSSQCKVMCPN